MESYLLDDLDDEIFWPSQPPLPLTQSSFAPYTKPSFLFSSLENEYPNTRPKNAHKRMMELLRTIPTNKSNNNTSDESREFEKDRSYKHMINERLRREKQKHTYDALHSLLLPGTKKDKNSVLQMAALNLRELKQLKENLHKRNQELENNVAFISNGYIVDRGETYTLRLRRPTPPSGIDSIIGVLTTLRNMGLKARSIQAEFSNTEFFAVLEIEPKIEAVIIENAVESALEEIERKYVDDMTTMTEW